jgi:hypothetical protein
MSWLHNARRSAALVGAGVGALLVTLVVPAGSSAFTTGSTPAAPATTASGSKINCSDGNRFICLDVNQSDDALGHYVGHDEPTLLFDSTEPGSGNQMSYNGILPVEPPATNVPGAATYDFQLYPAIWFGMAVCDTQSFPETVSTCIPDSNTNISSPGSPYHAGAAYMELQFYPPGYVQQFAGFSCSATQWCAALTIDSLSLNPITGEQLNQTCLNAIGGSIEYVNFAYLTKNGVPQGPPNPVQFDTVKSGQPNPNKDLFLNQGDHFNVTMHDTQHGLQTIVTDTTTGKSGSMTASAANGFGQVKFAPKGTSCTNIPYDFHPMYSTSTPKTTVPWAAATYNVAFDTEIGHFDYCSHAVDVTFYGGNCSGTEGAGANVEPTDADDVGCFPPSASTLIAITGCLGSNLGYDGTSYLPDWPNGNHQKTPTPTIISSPLTGPAYNMNYQQVAFNTDLPSIEQSIGTCDANTGAGCSLIPPTDDNNAPAAFYPYYTSGHALGGCAWSVGQDVPSFTTNDYGQNSQFGSLLKVTYPELNGTKASFYNDFQQILPDNPCPAPEPKS